VLSALNQLGERLHTLRRSLDEALELARFDSEVTEMSAWIDEKAGSLRGQAGVQHQHLPLEEKLQKLRKVLISLFVMT